MAFLSFFDSTEFLGNKLQLDTFLLSAIDLLMSHWLIKSLDLIVWR